MNTHAAILVIVMAAVTILLAPVPAVPRFPKADAGIYLLPR